MIWLLNKIAAVVFFVSLFCVANADSKKNPGVWSSVIINVNGVSAKVNEHWVVLNSTNQSVDLLTARDNALVLFAEKSIPIGNYSELKIKTDNKSYGILDGKKVDLVIEKDLSLKGNFKVVKGYPSEIKFAFNPKNDIESEGKKNKLNEEFKITSFKEDIVKPTLNFSSLLSYSNNVNQQIVVGFSDPYINLNSFSIKIDGIERRTDFVVSNSQAIGTVVLEQGLHTVQASIADLAGNLAISDLKTITIDRVAPVINFVSSTIRTNQNLVSLVANFSDSLTGIDLSKVVLKVDGTINATLPQVIGSQLKFTLTLPDGEHNISISIADFAGNISIADAIAIIDKVVPQITTIFPAANQIFYSNKLPYEIPLHFEFNEPIASIKVGGQNVNISIGGSIDSLFTISNPGDFLIPVEVIDLAGNVLNLSVQGKIDFSNIPAIINLLSPSLSYLTNLPVLQISGAVDKIINSVKVNGVDLNIAADGLSFFGEYILPTDGLYNVKVAVQDIYGNISEINSVVRYVQGLPDSLRNYQLPKFGWNGVNFNFEPGFPWVNKDVCSSVKSVFDQLGYNIDEINKLDPSNLASLFPPGYTPNIPYSGDVISFMGDVKDPLNDVKSAFLMTCEGLDIIGHLQCPQGREYFNKLFGKYPEVEIIDAIPTLPLSVKEFLTPRINICTGFDTSGLTCNEILKFVPLLADFAIPGLGAMLGSPVGQFLMEEAACKNLCDNPIAKTTPICNSLPLPQLPPMPNVADISIGGGIDTNWGGSGGGGLGGIDFGGGGCGGWFSSCGDGGSGGSGGLPSLNFACSSFPTLWSCGSDGASNGTVVTVDPNVTCPAKISDLFAFSGPDFPNYFTSVMASCVPGTFPGLPRITPPVITLVAPVQGFVPAAGTVKVQGSVNDLYSLVRINGQDVPAYKIGGKLSFDYEVTVPTDRKILVEAVDQWGNRAAPVEVMLGESDNGAGARFTSFTVDYCANGIYLDPINSDFMNFHEGLQADPNFVCDIWETGEANAFSFSATSDVDFDILSLEVKINDQKLSQASVDDNFYCEKYSDSVGNFYLNCSMDDTIEDLIDHELQSFINPDPALFYVREGHSDNEVLINEYRDVKVFISNLEGQTISKTFKYRYHLAPNVFIHNSSHACSGAGSIYDTEKADFICDIIDENISGYNLFNRSVGSYDVSTIKAKLNGVEIVNAASLFEEINLNPMGNGFGGISLIGPISTLIGPAGPTEELRTVEFSISDSYGRTGTKTLKFRVHPAP